MGYDIYITRKQHWFDEDGPEISESEWLDVASRHRELLRLAGTHDFELRKAQASRYLFYSSGQIFMKKPTREALMLMISLSKELKAHVQGEEGELYQENGVPDKVVRQFTIDDRW